MSDSILDMHAQPDDSTCGPTCLHAVYQHYGDRLPLQDVIREIPVVPGGGTLGVYLANHALRRGYGATTYTYNLRVFDPTWFRDGKVVDDIDERLVRQLEYKDGAKFQQTTLAYLDFLRLGGDLRYADLDETLLSYHLERGEPILVGLSATYLYGCARELGEPSEFDDVRGRPMGHFVVLTAYDRETHKVRVADPLHTNPIGAGHYYDVSMPRLVGAIYLGVMTYDGNLLVLHRGKAERA